MSVLFFIVSPGPGDVWPMISKDAFLHRLTDAFGKHYTATPSPTSWMNIIVKIPITDGESYDMTDFLKKVNRFAHKYEYYVEEIGVSHIVKKLFNNDKSA